MVYWLKNHASVIQNLDIKNKVHCVQVIHPEIGHIFREFEGTKQSYECMHNYHNVQLDLDFKSEVIALVDVVNKSEIFD